MSHDLHDGKGSYLFEGCDRCSQLAGSIEELDNTTLVALAHIARMIHDGTIYATSVSYPEIRAISMDSCTFWEQSMPQPV